MNEPKEGRGAWKSKWGFILAAAGSAVGLGNIWKFPYITGENGGGLFVLIYLGCIALVGLPIMVAEIMIGRAAQKQAVPAFTTLTPDKPAWAGVGWLGLLAGFVILSYYIVVAGWAMDYTLKSVVDFVKRTGLHSEAELDSTIKRATTPMVAMREALSRRKSEHTQRDEVAAIKKRAPNFVWNDHDRYLAAMKAAGGSEEARGRLLEIPTLRANVSEAEQLTQQMNTTRAEHLKRAESFFAALDDREVRDLFESQVRQENVRESVTKTFLKTASDGWQATFWTLVFMLMTITVVARGISGGIERWCKILMPILIVLILVMVAYGTTRSGFGEALSFVFSPDISKLKASGVLEALGHAFFTLSLGMGGMITYGSYQKSKDSLVAQSVAIAGLDTAIALLACMMMFPIVFSYGQEPSSGPGLVFMSMPLAFAEIGPIGMLLSILFFGLLVFAALTSAISLLEVVASYFIDQKQWGRRKAAWILGGATFLFGLPSAWSMSGSNPLASWAPTFGLNFFDTMDYLASNWLLTLGGLLIAIYAGWVMPKRVAEKELDGTGAALVMVWFMLIRFIAPILVIAVLAQKVGILDADEILYMMSH